MITYIFILGAILFGRNPLKTGLVTARREHQRAGGASTGSKRRNPLKTGLVTASGELGARRAWFSDERRNPLKTGLVTASRTLCRMIISMACLGRNPLKTGLVTASMRDASKKKW